MTNYIETIKNATNIEEVKQIVENINSDILDNNEVDVNYVNIKNALDAINEDNKNSFTNAFCYALDINRKTAFNMLLSKPYYNTHSIKLEDNGTYTITDSTKIFSFINLEKGYQLIKHIETDKNGKAIANKSVTVFDALRFYGLTATFIRNLQKSNFEIDADNAYHLENVIVDNEKVFTEKDGETFASNSNNALEKQLNIIVKFFGYDVQMLKKDLPILKIKAQKIKQDKKNAQFTVNAIIDDNAILKFADAIFGVIASRINGKDIEIVTVKPTKEA